MSENKPQKSKPILIPHWVCVGCSYIFPAEAPKRYLRLGDARTILCTNCYLGLADTAEKLRKQLEFEGGSKFDRNK
jgi:hypothetical protein